MRKVRFYLNRTAGLQNPVTAFTKVFSQWCSNKNVGLHQQNGFNAKCHYMRSSARIQVT